jgi:hypothetical protein
VSTDYVHVQVIRLDYVQVCESYPVCLFVCLFVCLLSVSGVLAHVAVRGERRLTCLTCGEL